MVARKEVVNINLDLKNYTPKSFRSLKPISTERNKHPNIQPSIPVPNSMFICKK